MQRAVDGLLQTSATASPGRGESTLSLCQGFRYHLVAVLYVYTCMYVFMNE